MRVHAEFFRSRLPAAFGLGPLASVKLAEWLGSPRASLSAPLSAGYPQAFQSLNSLHPHFSFEAERFAAAALESYHTVQTRWANPEDRQGLAWRLISLYYSAYYAAHAILRLSGITVTQIDNWNAANSEFATLYQSPQLPALDLVSGYHVITLEASGSSISVSRAKVDSTHGSHTALWHEFRQLAERSYANNALNTSAHQTAAGEFTRKLNTSITIEGVRCQWPWMPVVRNRINYRLPEQIWGADAKRITPSTYKHIHDLIVSPTSGRIVTAAGDGLDWLRFSGSCVYLLTLLGHLIRDMELRATAKAYLPVLYKNHKATIAKLCAA